jgi:hypothetical protein
LPSRLGTAVPARRRAADAGRWAAGLSDASTPVVLDPYAIHHPCSFVNERACMSYIDTFDHEFVGFFGGLPVYHPLDTVSGNAPDSADFNCDPTMLVIGGGGGEHPALVLRRPDCAVAHFLTDWLEHYRHTLPLAENTTVELWYTPWDTFLDASLTSDDRIFLTFAGWNTQTYASFYQRCTSPAMQTPFEPTRDGVFESWVAACLGELILFAMPDMVPDLERHLPRARELVRPLMYLNILTPPPRLPLSYGRVAVNGTIQQGYNRWWPSESASST